SVQRSHTTTYDDGFGPLTFSNNETITYAGVESLVLLGGGTNNTFTVQTTAPDCDLSIFAGAGDDTVNIGDATNNLDLLPGAVHVFGDGGVNRLIIDDRASLPDGFSLANSQFTITNQSVAHSADLTYTADWGQFTRTATALVTYSDLAELDINGYDGDDAIAV